MNIRRQIFPRTPISIGAFIFIACVIPLVYWFELFVVLPALYEMWSPYFWMHFVVGHFLMLNVTGSYIGLLLIDNSVERHLQLENVVSDWRHCNTCNIQVPPRSSHCSVCKVCMLKRDHHCLFTGYCIGHHNHRLFMMFLFYTLTSCIYATYYNWYFLTGRMKLSALFFRAVFSVPITLTKQTVDEEQLYLLIFYIIIAATIFLLGMCIYHSKLVFRGSVAYENKYNNSRYNMGTKQNFINVFGEKWYISWLSPFISSKLPCDGFCWDFKPLPTKQL